MNALGVSIEWHISFPLMNSFNKTKTAIFSMQTMLYKDYRKNTHKSLFWMSVASWQCILSFIDLSLIDRIITMNIVIVLNHDLMVIHSWLSKSEKNQLIVKLSKCKLHLIDTSAKILCFELIFSINMLTIISIGLNLY